MGCACSCDYYEGESAEFYREKIVKARKKHKCHECYQPILPGEEYETVTGMWDGRIYTHKTCSACVEIRNKLCDCWLFENVWEQIRELDDIDVSDMDGLSMTAINKMQKMYFDWKED